MAHPTPSPIDWSIASDVRGVRLGLVRATGVTIGPASPDLRSWCVSQVADLKQRGMAGGEPRREAVRAMLRAGGFKPAGRNKPSQEYLLRTMSESGTIPEILNVVDVLNVISLCSGLPISLLAAERIGRRPMARYGRPGEQFVFNRSGQALELEGLLCLCNGDGPDSNPLGTPVKDSMAGKVSDLDRDVWGVIYAPARDVAAAELEHWCQRLAEAYRDGCGAEVTGLATVASAIG